MKQIVYIGVILLAGLAIVLWPKTGNVAQAAITGSSGDWAYVFGSDAPPFIAPTPISIVPKTTFIGEGVSHQAALYLVNFPESYWAYYVDSRRGEIRPDDFLASGLGMEMFLKNSKTGDRVNFSITRYIPGAFGPQGDRLIIEYPTWTTDQIGTYDLIVSAPGISTNLKGALEVLEAPVGGSTVIETPSLPVPERPAVEIKQDSALSPTISNYEVTGLIILTGTNWPNQQSGLTVSIREHDTDNVYQATLMSYTPLSSRAIFEMPYLPIKTYTAYDIIVATINGARTVIHNGLWLTDGS